MKRDREQKNILVAMETFKQMRNKIIENTLNKDPDIYFGLYCEGNELLNTYIVRIKIGWLLEHFELYKTTIDHKIPLSNKSYRKDCIVYYSKVFLKFLEMNGGMFSNVDFAIDSLSRSETALRDMIDFSETWENRCNQLCVIIKKNQREYSKIRKKMMEG